MNTRQLSSRRPFGWIVGLALLCAATWAAASVTRVYQWREADGVRVFSTAPPPRTVAHYSIRDIATPIVDAVQQARIDAQLARDRERVVAAAQEPRVDAAADVARDAAALVRARNQQQMGREPLPGERMHNARDGSRLTTEYFARQAHLNEAVARAQADLDAAERARDGPS